jgi:hypothetical protein
VPIDCQALEELVDREAPEDLKLELKSADYLQEPDWKTTIAEELTALANRVGGRLVIGIDDDGEFEGRQNFSEADLRQDLDNICHDKVSPRLDYDLQLLSCTGGDVAVIEVPRRSGMPHAIVQRSGPEIKTRKYYVRTKHGKRLADDHQLAAMFEAPDWRSSLRAQASTRFRLQPEVRIHLASPAPVTGIPGGLRRDSPHGAVSTGQHQGGLRVRSGSLHRSLSVRPPIRHRTDDALVLDL